MVVDGEIRAAISDAILREILRVMKEIFHATEDDLREVEDLITGCTHRVTPTESLAVIEEGPDDDRILECAVASRSELIVSGDNDLLRLGNYRNIRILRVADFLQAQTQH